MRGAEGREGRIGFVKRLPLSICDGGEDARAPGEHRSEQGNLAHRVMYNFKADELLLTCGNRRMRVGAGRRKTVHFTS